MSQSPTELENGSTNAAPGIPRWVKASGVIVLALIILFAVLHLSGAHGPASHMSSGEQNMTMTDGSPTP
ncbi:MAG: hypothetical protein H0X30_20215 [Anaerolineae bacterium]|nr:hypothetical protein [Anaerolineae bacterium]